MLIFFVILVFSLLIVQLLDARIGSSPFMQLSIFVRQDTCISACRCMSARLAMTGKELRERHVARQIDRQIRFHRHAGKQQYWSCMQWSEIHLHKGWSLSTSLRRLPASMVAHGGLSCKLACASIHCLSGGLRL